MSTRERKRPVIDPAPDTGAQAAGGGAAQPGGFRLLRYFTISTLVAFVAVGTVLVVLEGLEGAFFEKVQREQAAFFAQAQVRLASQHEEAARSSLLAVHEASHVNLTRQVANMLWASDIGPFVAATQRLPIDHCRAMPAGGAAADAARGACFKEVGRRIVALPGFRGLDAKAYAAMRDTTVFKIKVFDPRGITVYSSEHVQIGDDAADNAGRKGAMAGLPASELTHRDRFSAFERVVENRDLISTYVPVRAPGGTEVVGIVELYSDVTPFLEQIRVASRKFADITAANEERNEQSARSNQRAVDASSNRFLAIVGGLLALLYAASWLIVRNGQRIIDRQRRAQEQANQRERQWHRERMAALAAMAANVSHEVGNPLAIIAGVAQELHDCGARDGSTGAGAPGRILEQISRIAMMMREISDFATARGERPEWIDVNAAVKAVCDFQRFGFRIRGMPIEFRPEPGLPACELVPDHLNEVMMRLLQAIAEGAPQQRQGGTILVETSSHGSDVVIRVDCAACAAAPNAAVYPEASLAAVRRRVAEMGWKLSNSEATVQITLPQAAATAAPAG